MTARRPVVRIGGQNVQLPPSDTLDVPAAWDALKTPAVAAGALALDLSSPAGFRVALNQNVTALTFAGVPSGRVVVFTVTWVQDAAGGRTVAFPASVKADGGGAPVQPAAGANAVTVQSFYTDDGGVTAWQAAAAAKPVLYYETTVQWVAGGNITISHPLGVSPKNVQFEAVAKAVVGQLSIGQSENIGASIVRIGAASADEYQATYRKATSTELQVQIGNRGLAILNSSGGFVGVTNAQADLKVKVFA